MVRCYLVQERVAGFGLQAVNALHMPPAGNGSHEVPVPTQRLYHPPDLAHLQGLRRRLETEWVPELERTLGIRRDELPLLWDCDFLHGEPAHEGDERYVLCEINVSSVFPIPDEAPEALAATTLQRLAAAREKRVTPA